MSVFLQVGPIAIQTYTLLICLGILGGCLVIGYFGGRQGFSMEHSIGAVLWVITFALVGGRVTHVAANWSGYSTQLELVLQMGRPLAFHGILMGGMLGLALYASLRRSALGPLADIMAMGFPVVQSLGWIGALVQGLGHGKASYDGWTWDLPDAYGIVMPRFPTQVVGSLMAVAILYILWTLWQRHEILPGQQFGVYLLLNSALYFGLEFARADQSLMLGQLRLAQVAYLAELVAAISLLINLRRRAKAMAGRNLVPD